MKSVHFSSEICEEEVAESSQRSSAGASEDKLYREWLKQLTINAVGRALQCQSYLAVAASEPSFSGSVSELGCSQEGGENSSLGLMEGSFVHFLKKHPSQTLSLTLESSKKNKKNEEEEKAGGVRASSSMGWNRPSKRSLPSLTVFEENERPNRRSLGKDSDERRRYIGAWVFSLLMEWHHGGFQEQWRTQAASATELFAEAICKRFDNTRDEDFSNPSPLLESHLLFVLRHFEAGNGLCLLKGTEPLHPLRPCHNESSKNGNQIHTLGTLAQVEARGMLQLRFSEQHSGEQDKTEWAAVLEQLDCSSRLAAHKPKHSSKLKISAAVQEKPNERRLGLKAAAGFWLGCGLCEMIDIETESRLQEDPNVSESSPNMTSSVIPSHLEDGPQVLSESPPQSSEEEGRERHISSTEESGLSNGHMQSSSTCTEEDDRHHQMEEMQDDTDDPCRYNEGREEDSLGRRVSLRMLMMKQGETSELGTNNGSPASSPSPSSCSWEKWEEPAEKLDPQCCICMMGLKGAAFVPCGHTFCRRCSRELWRSRGTCPLCNKFIAQILDIF